MAHPGLYCVLIVAGAICATGAEAGAETMSQPIPLKLTLQIEPHDLRLLMVNHTNHRIRVWHTGNSWGDASWSLRITVGGAAGRKIVLRAANQRYTRNVPRFIEVPAHGKAEMKLAPDTHVWTAGEDIEPLRNAPWEIQVILEIAPSPEATIHQVAIGAEESAPVPSTPPHSWLSK